MDGKAARIVCFDLGGVVVRTCRTWSEACRESGLEYKPDVDAPLVQAQIRALSDRYDLGLLSGPDWRGEISAATGGLYSPAEIAVLHEAWLLGEYDGIGALVTELNRIGGMETACLSNTNPEHWEQMGSSCGRHEFTACRAIRRRLASFQLRLAKPDPSVYEEFGRRTGVRPGEIVFFDDRPENVGAARSVGWLAFRVDPEADTTGQMRTELGRLGIL